MVLSEYLEPDALTRITARATRDGECWIVEALSDPGVSVKVTRLTEVDAAVGRAVAQRLHAD
jgi:hypothetical protein